MTEEQKKIKKYVNAIERHLHMSLKMKARINSDLATEIHLRMEAGATADEVIQEMGRPKEVAERLNEEMGAKMGKKSYISITFLCLAAFCTAMFLVFLIGGIIENQRITQEIKEASISIIGGADGPASIFIAESISPFGKGMMVLGVAAGFLSAYFLTVRRKSSSVIKRRCMILSVTGFLLTAFPPAQLWLLSVQGTGVGISGYIWLLLILGAVINVVTFTVALRKKKDGSS